MWLGILWLVTMLKEATVVSKQCCHEGIYLFCNVQVPKQDAHERQDRKIPSRTFSRESHCLSWLAFFPLWTWTWYFFNWPLLVDADHCITRNTSQYLHFWRCSALSSSWIKGSQILPFLLLPIHQFISYPLTRAIIERLSILFTSAVSGFNDMADFWGWEKPNNPNQTIFCSVFGANRKTYSTQKETKALQH